jgi:hypothetical protein
MKCSICGILGETSKAGHLKFLRRVKKICMCASCLITKDIFSFSSHFYSTEWETKTCSQGTLAKQTRRFLTSLYRRMLSSNWQMYGVPQATHRAPALPWLWLWYNVLHHLLWWGSQDHFVSSTTEMAGTRTSNVIILILLVYIVLYLRYFLGYPHYQTFSQYHKIL